MKRFALAALLTALGALLAVAIGEVPPATPAPTSRVLAELPVTGVQNPVTAVLLSFRAYDTLLELAVLLLALAGVHAMAVAEREHGGASGTVLRVLAQLLVPFLILFAAYLLWAGSSEPGGAFQAGAVLAAAGLLVVLTGEPVVRAPLAAMHVLASLGLIAFVAAAFGTLAAGANLLEYRAPASKAVILAIEACATVAIGFTLLGVFRGGRPPDDRP